MDDFQTISIGLFKPTGKIVFCNAENEVVGTLYFDGPMRFKGDASASAKIFFRCYVKPLADQYIASLGEVKAGIDEGTEETPR